MFAQTIPYKAVWYRPVKDSFWGELADDSGPSPTPRLEAVKSIDQNFYGIAVNMHATAVALRLPDDDTFFSQLGGGFSYDPRNRQKPQFAVAQEIIVAIAAKYNLKVIFATNQSGYHVFTDDNFGNQDSTTRSWDYLQSILDPTLFYGTPATTELAAVGLSDRNIHSFIGDPRIAGWFFWGEWDFTQPTETTYLSNWWWDFYTLVHWGGANTAFVGAYPISSLDSVPDDPSCNPARLSAAGATSPMQEIQAFKNFFQGQTYKPDVYGIEWYGDNSYRLSCIAPDLQTLGRAMRDDTYAVPTQNIMLMEGGSNQVSNPGLSQFYLDSINTAANLDGVAMSGIVAWNSDGNVNTSGSCTTGDDPAQVQWALAKVSPITVDGCATSNRQTSGQLDPVFSNPAAGWHAGYDAGSLFVVPPYPTAFGLIYYYDMTTAGYALAQGYGAH